MKVLTITNCPLIESQGSGYVIINFAKGLRRLGHSVDLFGPEHFEFLPLIKVARLYRLALGMLLCAVSNLRRNSYDIVEFYGGQAWLATEMLSRRARRDFLIVAHSNGIEPHADEQMARLLGSSVLKDGGRKWFQSLLPMPLDRAFKSADAIVTVSQFDRAYALERRLQPAERIECIENRLSDDFLGLERVDARAPVIGYCGSWLPRKGSACLAEGVRRLLAGHPECRAKLIGVGEEFEKGQWFPPEICDRIEVIPFVEDRSELRQIYYSISILMAPSVYESFGLAVAEAMACGCAVVATKTGFAAGLRSRREVMHLDDETADSLVSAVAELLGDEALRRTIGEGGRQSVQALRWETGVKQLEALYQRWLSSIRAPEFLEPLVAG